MRIARYEADGRPGFGIASGDDLIDAHPVLGDKIASLRDLLAADNLARLREIAEGPPSRAQGATRFLPMLLDPQKIICVGVNYENRNEEYKDGTAPPPYPSLFMRSPDSLTAHGEALVRPPESPELDYEGEIAVVIGEGGRRIPAETAERAIAGLTLMNEGTIRDWVRHAKFNVTQGKNFDRSGAIGPWMTTADEFSSYADLDIQTRVNGELRQDDVTTNMRFSISYLISYISTFTTLHPGDVIATGTPIGAGARFHPPRYLKPGDVVEVSSSRIGVLRNTVRDEA